MRATAAFGAAVFLTCVGFAVGAFQWFLYLPGILLRRLMILVGLKVSIPPWTALGLEFSFNVLAWFVLVFLALTVLAARR